jgi:hypothetical protein
MEGTTAGALIPEIVRRGFQDLLEAEVSAAIGANCPVSIRLMGGVILET